MGIALSDSADFSGIGNGDFLINEVRHKAYIDVDEEGTEAAAATGIGFSLALTRWDFKGIVVANPSIAIRLLETVAKRTQDDGTQ